MEQTFSIWVARYMRAGNMKDLRGKCEVRCRMGAILYQGTFSASSRDHLLAPGASRPKSAVHADHESVHEHELYRRGRSWGDVDNEA